MDALFLVNVPVSPKLPSKINYSPQTSRSEYFTPQSSIQSNQTSSDSDSTLSDQSSTEHTDYEDFVNIPPKKHVRFDVPAPTTEIHLKLENDEAEFFAYIPSEDSIKNTTKSIRKRDRISSIFSRKFNLTNSNNSDSNNNEWNEILVKTLVSMRQDMQEIIGGFDQIDQSLTDDSPLNITQPIITKPHLSFRERQREKLEMMRISTMLNPPNLLTYNLKESPYPYTDIIEPHNFNFLRVTKRIPDENLFIQHKPFRHKKFFYRTQRGLLKMQHDLRKLKHDIYGKSLITSHKELPALDVQNYRNRLEKTLLEVRTQMAEYDRINSSKNNNRKSISQIIEKLKAIDPASKAQIDDYRTKLRPIEYIDKKQKNELISAPYIPRRARYRLNNVKKENKKDDLIDKRFDRATFIDLNEDAEEFFGFHIPFWNQPPDLRLSILLPPSICQSDCFVLPSKIGIWDRFVSSFRSKQKKLRSVESNENDDEFFDCLSPSFQQRKSQPSIPFNEDNNTDF